MLIIPQYILLVKYIHTHIKIFRQLYPLIQTIGFQRPYFDAGVAGVIRHLDPHADVIRPPLNKARPGAARSCVFHPIAIRKSTGGHLHILSTSNRRGAWYLILLSRILK